MPVVSGIYGPHIIYMGNQNGERDSVVWGKILLQSSGVG